MPTYEYACSACNNEWEFEQSIKDDPIKECPKCHEQTARRQISRGTGFILKGSSLVLDLYSSSSNTKADRRRRQAERHQAVVGRVEQHGFVELLEERVDDDEHHDHGDAREAERRFRRRRDEGVRRRGVVSSGRPTPRAVVA